MCTAFIGWHADQLVATTGLTYWFPKEREGYMYDLLIMPMPSAKMTVRAHWSFL
jgi:hypothetical protein